MTSKRTGSTSDASVRVGTGGVVMARPWYRYRPGGGETISRVTRHGGWPHEGQ